MNSKEEKLAAIELLKANKAAPISSTIRIYDLLIHNKAFDSHIGAPFLW